MIYEIASSLESFKGIKFSEGMNILLTERTPGEEKKRHTRNGAGKSSLLDVIHFLMGGNATLKGSIFRLEALEKFDFSIDMDLGDGRLTTSRKGNKSSIVTMRGEVPGWPSEIPTPDADTRISLSIEDWRTVLGNVVFNIPVGLPSYSPTFRMLFPFFVRNNAGGGFLEPTETRPKQKAWIKQVSLSALLGLDWEISRNFEGWRGQDAEMKQLRKLSKDGELSEVIGTASELRPKVARAEGQLARLKESVEGFKVVPQYRQLEREASKIKRLLDKLSDENTTDRILKDQLLDALASEAPPEADSLFELYEQAGVLLKDNIKHRFDEVQEFHQAVVRNRKIHLQSELDSLRGRIVERSNKMNEEDQHRTSIMFALRDGGALEQLTSIQAELGKAEAHAESLREKMSLVKKVEKSQLNLKSERIELQKQLQDDINERDAIITDAINIFHELAVSLYGDKAQANLKIESTKKGLVVEPTIQGIRSEGIRSMLIFCFDLMLTILMTRQGRGPGFLAHDSHLFDGVDERQAAIALETAGNYAKKEGFQYIVTMNSDFFSTLHDFSDDFYINDYVLETRLTDEEDGGLFGFRFD